MAGALDEQASTYSRTVRISELPEIRIVLSLRIAYFG